MALALVPDKDFFTSQNSNYWIDRPLWGNRFYNDQSPDLIILEFLMILEAYTSDASEDSEDGSSGWSLPQIKVEGELAKHPEVAVKVSSVVNTRRLIYGEPYLDIILHPSNTSRTPWQELVDKTSLTQAQVNSLQSKVSITELRMLLEYFRDASFDSGDKRWSSRFLFPYGSSCLFPDGRPKGEGFSADRRFFARGGELLFFMLTRAKFDDQGQQYDGKDLLIKISDRFLSSTQPTNDLFHRVRTIFGELNRDKSVKTGYLPFRELSNYNQLAKDIWILFHKKLPIEVLYEHLGRIVVLHFLRYYLEQAQRVLHGKITFSDEEYSWKVPTDFHQFYTETQKQPLLQIEGDLDEDDKAIFVCAAAQNQDGILLDKVKQMYNHNMGLGIEAVVRLETERMRLLKFEAPDAQIEARKEELRDYHQKKSDFRAAYVYWLAKIGLATPKRGRRHFIVSNKLARTLVVMLVDEPVEYNEFLNALAQKYRIVIGPEAAEAVGLKRDQIDFSALERNEILFAETLRKIGLLNSLSDDCSYVQNPYYV